VEAGAKQSVLLCAEVWAEIRSEARRTGRSRSNLVQLAWRRARDDLRKLMP
jgi:uncharacterized small protein (TIGR04563 family)